jgi:hypothetical protein
MSCNVINAGHLFNSPREPQNVSGGGVHWTLEDACRIFGPSVKELPFVTMATDGNPFANAANYWNDVPTENSHADFQRGKTYAALTIKAIANDGCGSNYLKDIIEAIAADAIARQARGGKYSRSLPPAVGGFFSELSLAPRRPAS